jgi:hypothetical protein
MQVSQSDRLLQRWRKDSTGDDAGVAITGQD